VSDFPDIDARSYAVLASCVFTALQDFVETHGRCGFPMVGDAGPITDEGYQLTVFCGCGTRFERWVTPQVAGEDLVTGSMLAGPN
jgi:hypothetical protein